MRSFLLILFLIASVSTVKLGFSLEAYKSQCFYEYFYHETKYRFSLEASHPTSYQVQQVYMERIEHSQRPKSLALYQHIKGTQGYHQSVHVHKFASQQGIHGFCIKNLQPQIASYKLNLQSGIQLMELQGLAAQNDTASLISQLTIIQTQINGVAQSLTSIERSKSLTAEISQLMSGKAVFFSIFALLIIVLINVAFYTLLKKTLRDKKRI